MNNRYATATRGIVASLIARRNAGDLTTMEAADKMRMEGVSIDVTLRTLAGRK